MEAWSLESVPIGFFCWMLTVRFHVVVNLLNIIGMQITIIETYHRKNGKLYRRWSTPSGYVVDDRETVWDEPPCVIVERGN